MGTHSENKEDDDKKPSNDDRKIPNWVTGFLIVVITAVWVTSYIIGLFNPDVQPPEQINLLFSSMVGALLLNAAKKRGGDGE